MIVENRPAAHAACVLLPSQVKPIGHTVHEVRVPAVLPAVYEPALHVLQLLEPAVLYAVSRPHGVCVLLPSHVEPAGHVVHEVCVVVPPPAVNEPEPHVLQLLALVPLYLVSPPHATHAAAPPVAKRPALHGVLAPSPAHAVAGGHAMHDVRDVAVPPAVYVYDPARHTPQLEAPLFVLNLLPLHPVHELIPAAAYLPAVHTALVLLPLHEWPAGHALHEARVVQLPPAVKEPAPHVLQLVDPVPLYLLSLPHGVCTLLPSHTSPAGHASHEMRVVDVPPAVNEPAVHVLQLAAPAVLNLVSPPHGVCTLEPSHVYPGGHALHEVRLLAPRAPAVNDPAVHVLHNAASSALNLSSLPHTLHVPAPPGA